MINNQVNKIKLENQDLKMFYILDDMHAHVYVMLRDLVREYQFVETFPGSVI